MFNLNFFYNSIILLFLSFVREFFSSNSTMNAILNVFPIKKRKETIKPVNCSSITQHNHSRIPRRIFQNKNKNVITQEFNIALHVIIFRAEGLDKFENYPYVKNRDYNVVYWTKPGEEIHTDVVHVKGFVTPQWNQYNVIVLENLDDEVFLNVEVQRFNSLVDPGTSSGKVVVGRAKIPILIPDPIPTFKGRKVVSFPLIRSDEKGNRVEGNILLSMRFQKIKTGTSAPYFADDLFLNDDEVKV